MIVTPIETRAGDSLTLEFPVVDEATKAAVDLTSATIQWGIKHRLIPVVGALVVKTTAVAGGISIVGDSKNVARVQIGKGEIPAGKFEYELEVTLASGASFTAASGPFDAAPAVFAS